MHRLYREEYGEIELQLLIGTARPQLELAAPPDHVPEHLVERERVLTGPPGDELADLPPIPVEECRSGFPPPPGLHGEEALQLTIVDSGVADRIAGTLLGIVLPQSLFEPRQGIDAGLRLHLGLRAGEVRHQLVHVLELAERRPSRVPLPPAPSRLEPDREGLGEVLVRVRLRVPEVEVQHEALARWPWPVEVRIPLRGLPEELLPAPAALELVRVLDGVPRLVA